MIAKGDANCSDAGPVSSWTPKFVEEVQTGRGSIRVECCTDGSMIGLRFNGYPADPIPFRPTDPTCQLFLTELVPQKLGLEQDESIVLQKHLLSIGFAEKCSQALESQGTRGWEQGADKFEDVQKARNEITGTLLLSSREMTTREKYDWVSRVAYKHLFSTGRFYFDAEHFEGFWFDRATKVLYRLPTPHLTEAERTQAYMADRFAVNQEDSAFRWILSGIYTRVAHRAERTRPRMFSHFNKERGVLYINNKPGRMLKLDGQDVKEVDNGEDGVVFLWNEKWEPWDYQSVGVGLWKSLVYSRFCLDRAAEEESLSIDELTALLDVYIEAILFRSVVPHRPILAHIGPFGSGKTFAAMSVGLVLFGPNFQVIGLEEEKQDAIIAYITNNVFGVLDNADERIKWLPDVLARAATGQSIPKRRLYTTNELVEYVVDVLLAITARTTPWARPDVVSRLIPLPFQQPKAFRSEEKMKNEILSSRQCLLSELVGRANGSIVRLVTDVSETESPSRLAGFYDFGIRISKDSLVFRSAFEKVVAAQRVMTYQEHETLLTLLKEWIIANLPKGTSSLDEIAPAWTSPIAAADVYGELASLARERGLRLEARTPNGLGMVLRNIRPTLSDLGIEFKVIRKSKANLWSFRCSEPETRSGH
jgi:hypothetical protein